MYFARLNIFYTLWNTKKKKTVKYDDEYDVLVSESGNHLITGKYKMLSTNVINRSIK